jgi:hypothetical protein
LSEIENPIPKGYDDRAAEIQRLRDELATVQAATPPEAATTLTTAEPVTTTPAAAAVASTASQSRIAQLVAKPVDVVETPADGQKVATHAVAPGSAGDTVRELAALVERAGEPTYLSDPKSQNHAHVFTDELLAGVRRVLYNHPEIANADGPEGDVVKRWIRDLELVSADVWALLEEIAAGKAAPAA